jgi:hypothetical protein
LIACNFGLISFPFSKAFFSKKKLTLSAEFLKYSSRSCFRESVSKTVAFSGVISKLFMSLSIYWMAFPHYWDDIKAGITAYPFFM